MDKDKINWCLKQKNGIQLIEKKEHLSSSYMNEADETLDNMLKIEGKWKTITAYYACYNALYSILMKCGIKTEIHSCSIELMILFEFSQIDKIFLEKLKEDRIQAQYYLKEKILKDENEIKEFVLKCKLILHSINSEKIEKIRELFRSNIT